jgi:hypothetical protein
LVYQHGQDGRTASSLWSRAANCGFIARNSVMLESDHGVVASKPEDKPTQSSELKVPNPDPFDEENSKKMVARRFGRAPRGRPTGPACSHSLSGPGPPTGRDQSCFSSRRICH